jgi:choline transport protein
MSRSSEKMAEAGEPRKSIGESKKSVQEEFEKRTQNIVEVLDGEEVNASGHHDELQRQYSIWSLCGLALTIDSAWIALGGSIAVAVANGGPPGILYEFLGKYLVGLFGAALLTLCGCLLLVCPFGCLHC